MADAGSDAAALVIARLRAEAEAADRIIVQLRAEAEAADRVLAKLREEATSREATMQAAAKKQRELEDQVEHWRRRINEIENNGLRRATAMLRRTITRLQTLLRPRGSRGA